MRRINLGHGEMSARYEETVRRGRGRTRNGSPRKIRRFSRMKTVFMGRVTKVTLHPEAQP